MLELKCAVCGVDHSPDWFDVHIDGEYFPVLLCSKCYHEAKALGVINEVIEMYDAFGRSYAEMTDKMAKDPQINPNAEREKIRRRLLK